jgi:hypothetical protein
MLKSPFTTHGAVSCLSFKVTFLLQSLRPKRACKAFDGTALIMAIFASLCVSNGTDESARCAPVLRSQPPRELLDLVRDRLDATIKPEE